MGRQYATCSDLFRVLNALDHAWEYEQTLHRRTVGLNSTDQKVIGMLELNPAPSSGELAAALGLSSAGITAVLDRLEARDFITRRTDDADRRRIVIGRGAQFPTSRSMGAKFMRTLHQACAGYSPEQRTELVDLLQQILNELAAQHHRTPATIGYRKERSS